MPARRSRSSGPVGEREKLQALVDLKAGESVHGIARRLGVAASSVRRWRDQALAMGETFPPPSAPDGSPGDPQKGRPWSSPLPPEEVDRRLAAYMAEALEALHVQITLLADREWLEEQSADDVAVAHGVVFDKLARLAAGTAEGAGGPVLPPGRPAGR